MALFDTDAPKTLQDVLGGQADARVAGIQDTAARGRKRLISQQAHLGRLGSGVADYPLADFDADTAGDVSGVYSGLASALGQVPAEGYLNDTGFNRNLDLTKLIGGLNKPSKLMEALGLLGNTARIAGTAASFA